MKAVTLRPPEPERDFAQLATWFSVLEDDSLSEQGLKEYYGKRREKIIQRVADNEEGGLQGFYWVYFNNVESCSIDLFVKPGQRRQGFGKQLYEDLEKTVKNAQVNELYATIMDTSAESRIFAEHRGFNERWHFIPMGLNLETFDHRAYDEIIVKLEGDGFLFTSMEELGNTENSQRHLHTLNDETNLDMPGHLAHGRWCHILSKDTSRQVGFSAVFKQFLHFDFIPLMGILHARPLVAKASRRVHHLK